MTQQEIILSAAYMALAEKFEGCHLQPYDDGAGKLTIGIGHLIKQGEEKLYLGGMSIPQALSLLHNNKEEFLSKTAKLTLAQVHELKNRDMAKAVAQVADRLKRWALPIHDVPQRCLEVLVDLAFNAGPGSLDGGIAERMKTRDFDGAILFSPKYCLAEDPKAKPKKILVPFTGLTLRRFSFVWYYFVGEAWRIGASSATRWQEVEKFLAGLTVLLEKKGKKNPLPYPNNRKEAQKY